MKLFGLMGSRRAGAAASGPTVPGAPTGVSATAGDTEATVSFSAPASDGGATITGYRVTSTPGSLTATGASSPITITGLTNGQEYTFTLAALNSAGWSDESDPSNAVTPAAAGGFSILLESGDSLLLESGDQLLLEEAA